MDDKQLAELVERGKRLYPARSHHPLCPTRPGQPLAAGAVCADCVYGADEFRKRRDKAGHRPECTRTLCYCADPGYPDPMCICGHAGWACECPYNEESEDG